MIYRRLQHALLMLSGLLIVAGSVPKSRASSDHLFIPYIEQIRSKLAPGLLLRLPDQVPSINTLAGDSNYRVRVSPSLATPGMTVSIFNCKLESQACLVGSFAVNSLASSGDHEDFRLHQNLGIQTTIESGIRGYLLLGEKQNPTREFSSIMWEQDSLFYRVRLRSLSPESIVTVASSMAQAPPIDELADNIAINNTKPELPELPARPAVETPPTQVNTTPNNPVPATQPSPETAPTPPTQVNTTPNNPPPVTQPSPETALVTPPNRDSTATNNNNPIPSTPITPPLETTPKPETPTKITLVPIRLVKITGNTVLSDDKLQTVIAKFENKDFSPQDLPEKIKDLASQITNLYLEAGYITSKAQPLEQTITNGVVEISVIEGRLADIEVEGTQRLKPYVRSRIRLGKGDPINTAKIEDRLRLLKQDPLFKGVEASLRPAGKPGESILVVRVKEASSFTANVGIDNYSPASVGSEKAGVGLGYRSLITPGDYISVFYGTTSTRGSTTFDFSYRIPLNPMNGTLQLRSVLNWSEITQAPFNELNITGDKQVYELSYRQPLVRNSREELALSIGFIYDNGQTFTFDQPTPFGLGPDDNGVSRTSVIRFSQDYLRRDASGAWFLASQFNIGTGLFNATKNDAPVPDGYFFSWLGQAQRFQRFGDKNLLLLQADVQLTPNTLLPSQQFVIGGGQSVRGYRQNARSGDNGVRVALEDRITLISDRDGAPKLQIAPFIDLGLVWNTANNPNLLAKQSFLAGAGIGLILQPFRGLTLRIDYAYPFINLEDRSNNIQDQGLYFYLNYQL